MDETLIDNWNASVKQHDTVYILGDLFFRSKVTADVMLKRLNGKKNLIIGNHDKDWMKRTDLPSFFESVSNMVETSVCLQVQSMCYTEDSDRQITGSYPGDLRARDYFYGSLWVLVAK